MNEKRESYRSNVAVPLQVSHETFGTINVSSKDLSVGGIFVMNEAARNLPEEGSVINVKVMGRMWGVNEIDAEVVRVEDGGFGLRFLYDAQGSSRTH